MVWQQRSTRGWQLKMSRHKAQPMWLVAGTIPANLITWSHPRLWGAIILPSQKIGDKWFGDRAIKSRMKQTRCATKHMSGNKEVLHYSMCKWPTKMPQFLKLSTVTDAISSDGSLHNSGVKRPHSQLRMALTVLSLHDRKGQMLTSACKQGT